MSEQIARRTLADRIQAGQLGVQEYITICTVPGEPRQRTYEILLVLPCPGAGARPWLRLFTKLGYAGSTIIATPNFTSAEEMIRTGELAAIVHHDGDLCGKQYVIDEAMARARTDGIRLAPVFVFDNPLFVEHAESTLAAFLAMHCPLS